jgi:cellobiose phosphorylase
VTGRVAYLIVDGERVDGTVVPLAAPGTAVRVEAVVEG